MAWHLLAIAVASLPLLAVYELASHSQVGSYEGVLVPEKPL
jgi:hypothetical protein